MQHLACEDIVVYFWEWSKLHGEEPDRKRLGDEEEEDVEDRDLLLGNDDDEEEEEEEAEGAVVGGWEVGAW